VGVFLVELEPLGLVIQMDVLIQLAFSLVETKKSNSRKYLLEKTT